ncbi:unnamed protein product [Mytilus coruscus]|uniref:Putative nuclease HARBI1 n=1 Tax=Mytilus coruscus TaxID=42192 RepID=A0A6J8AS11_MYTCO|nr:unnamed protein product [Mytilus coruscus]
MRSIADRFDTAKSSVHNSVMNITGILAGLKSDYISWPFDDYRETAFSFQTRGNFPGVLGAIDGTHIEINAPEEHQKDYLNRKMSHFVILQAVCNNRGLFTDCFAGVPGSRHDAHVFRQSGIYKAINENKRQYFPSEQFHLVGDSAYPVMSWLLVPFKDFGDLTEEKQRYNFKLSQTRIVIEMAFGRLKGSYRRLHNLNTKLENIPIIIMSTYVLHNFRMLYEDEYTIEIEDTNKDFNDTMKTVPSSTTASSAGIKKGQKFVNTFN